MSSVNVWRAQTGAWAISPTLRLKIDSTHLVRRFFTPAECSWRNFWWRRFEFGDPTQEPGFPTNKSSILIEDIQEVGSFSAYDLRLTRFAHLLVLFMPGWWELPEGGWLNTKYKYHKKGCNTVYYDLCIDIHYIISYWVSGYISWIPFMYG